jgi:hypothetical protein
MAMTILIADDSVAMLMSGKKPVRLAAPAPPPSAPDDQARLMYTDAARHSQLCSEEETAGCDGETQW